MKKGNKITLTTDINKYEECDAECLYLDYENIVNVLKPGGRIFIDDGLISVIVDEVGKSVYNIHCQSGIVDCDLKWYFATCQACTGLYLTEL